MTTTLYYVPRTRSTRPRWLLEELGAPYELVRLDTSKGETRTDEHTRRHPLKHVPVLETKDGALFESAAIVLQLADLHGRFIPPVGSHERGLVYQWLFFAMTELEPHCVVYFTEKVLKKTPETPLALAAKAKVNEAAKALNAHLETREWMLPSGFSVADVVVGSVAWWANRMGAVEGAPHLLAYVQRCEARPAYQRATAD
ncbi:MAG: glutathione S-transferase family protein [Myxococcaceae bacterium]|jgi:glutathione S-transferase|nr:glutathione S-transferase family protein [Myxococcaceae bacterium]MCA3011803.1 glutathione S-transferase family protein [Myxococcaceae bacterium]